jgi:hypothetical protein
MSDCVYRRCRTMSYRAHGATVGETTTRAARTVRHTRLRRAPYHDAMMKLSLQRHAGGSKVAARWLAAASLSLLCVAPPSYAGVGLSISIGVPPPVAVVEPLPPPRGGYVYAPGYWAWHDGGYIWIGGRWILGRPGYVWIADGWEPVGGRWRFVQGHWAPRGHGHRHWRGRGRHD